MIASKHASIAVASQARVEICFAPLVILIHPETYGCISAIGIETNL